MAVGRNLKIYAGDDYAHKITVKNPDGSAKDVTGYTFAAQIKRRKGDTDALATFTVDTSDAVNGNVWLRLTQAQAAALAKESLLAWWDFQTVRTADNFKQTWMAGEVTFTWDVTS